MQTCRVTVGPDGQVTIPETRPGETITIQVQHDAEPPERLTRATAWTEKGRAAVAAADLASATFRPWRDDRADGFTVATPHIAPSCNFDEWKKRQQA
jgi:hypothetical protein